jgi:hypothetical protein
MFHDLNTCNYIPRSDSFNNGNICNSISAGRLRTNMIAYILKRETTVNEMKIKR